MIDTLTVFFFFFFNDTATTEIYTLSLHDALPICQAPQAGRKHPEVLAQEIGHEERHGVPRMSYRRSEEHTSELQSPCNLVCRLLLEKKKKEKNIDLINTSAGNMLRLPLSYGRRLV